MDASFQVCVTHYMCLTVDTGAYECLPFDARLSVVPVLFTTALELVNAWNRRSQGRYVYWLEG